MLIKKIGNFRSQEFPVAFIALLARDAIYCASFAVLSSFMTFFVFKKKNESERKINESPEMRIFELIPLLFTFYSYIDFLCNMLATNDSMSEEQSSMSSASSSPAQCSQQQFQNGSIGSPQVPHEKLSYMFNLYRMEGEWSSSTKE